MTTVPMVALDGRLHLFPEWLFLHLKTADKMLGRGTILRRAEPPHAKYLRVQPAAVHQMVHLQTPYYSPRKPLRAMRYDSPVSKSQSGRPNQMDLLWCGVDHLVDRAAVDQYAGELDHTVNPHTTKLFSENDRIVAEVKGRRVWK